MGKILSARETAIGRTVAMKVMFDGHSREELLRFLEEAKITGQLEHPNIVPVHELSVDEQKRVFYTMKFVKGGTLKKVLDQLRSGDAKAIARYTLAELLTIFQKVCDAVAFAHSNRVIHRDLKPENIMLGGFGEVLVMDWGLAKVLGGGSLAASAAFTTMTGNRKLTPLVPEELNSVGEAATPLKTHAAEATVAYTPPGISPAQSLARHSADLRTQMGSVMGTPHYMSPEQARGDIGSLDQRADIYALGVILYELLALRRPASGSGIAEVLGSVISGKVEPLPKTSRALMHLPGRRVPESLAAVAMKALSLEPEKRYATVVELQADITQYQHGFATGAEHAGLVKQVALLVKRNKGVFATAFAAWFIITALLAWFVLNLRAKESRAAAGEQKAVAAEAVAVREKETARQALAKSQLDLAEKEFERGKFVEAQKILDDTPESFRDANWRFLRANARDFTKQLSLAGKGSAYRLQVLPRGDRFAVRCWDGVIGIFTLTGRQIGDWISARGTPSGTFGIDSVGNRLAFAVSANEVAVLEVATGKLMHRWACKIGEISHVLLSPDGGIVLVAAGNQLIAYAAETGVPLWTKPFQAVVPAFSPDGRTVAILAARDGLTLKIELLAADAGTLRSTLEATADNPEKTTLQFNQAGDRLACLGGDEVILWNPQTAMKIRALHFPGETVKLLSPGGDSVATVSGSRIRLWDTTTGRLLRSLNGARNAVADLAFSPDGRMLLSAHDSAGDGEVNVWPIRLGEEIASASFPTRLNRGRIVFDPKGEVFYASSKLAATGWDIRSGIQRWNYSTKNINIDDLAIQPIDGSIVLAEFDEQRLTRLSITGEPLKWFGTHFRSSLRFNRGGQFLLAVETAFQPNTGGRALSVLEYPSGKVLKKIELNPCQPYAAFCLDDGAVATAATAGGITVWDWKAGTPLRQIAAAETGSIACLASSPDGRHLASGGPDRWIHVWEAATGRLEAAFRAHWEGVRCVKFSPDGRDILSGSEDGAVRLHDASTGEERLAFYGLNTPVVDVDFSPDGTLIAAITADGCAKVWDRKLSGAAALLPQRPSANKPAVAKAADGWQDLLAQLTAAEVAETGHGWRLENGELFSPNKMHATLPLPGDFSGTSYRVRVKLRQLPAKDVFHVVLPVGDRMTGFELDGFYGKYTGLYMVNGKGGKEVPGVVEGKQVKDAAPHVLEITVQLDGARAAIAATLDTRPLYGWIGPMDSLSQWTGWATTEPGCLALGASAADWAVSEVKVKRL